jgi:hypothetical protein
MSTYLFIQAKKRKKMRHRQYGLVDNDIIFFHRRLMNKEQRERNCVFLSSSNRQQKKTK